ncbi:MAG: M24 family metallopeptidase [Desulfarculaceae bacterium]
MKIHNEIIEKKRRLRVLMSELKLDAVLIRQQANFSWLTGGGLNLVGIATEMGASPLLLTRDKEYVVCNNIEAPRIEKEEKIPEQGYKLLTYKWFEEKERALIEKIVGKGRMGSDAPYPEAENISGHINQLRYSLTSWEVERYQKLGEMASKAVEEAIATIEPGDKECEIIGRLCQRLWADRVDFVTTFCAADERIANFRHPIATEKKIEKRAMLGVNARKWGLIVTLTRFVQFGKVPPELLKQYEDNVYVECVFIANTMPGTAVKDILQKGIEAYRERGYPEEYQFHHQGGATGYAGRDYRVNFNTPDVVEENQAFCWNPSIAGTKSEDTMLATSKGPVLLSNPVHFPVMEVEAKGQSFKRPAILEK